MILYVKESLNILKNLKESAKNPERILKEAADGNWSQESRPETKKLKDDKNMKSWFDTKQLLKVEDISPWPLPPLSSPPQTPPPPPPSWEERNSEKKENPNLPTK